jgi:hypothetical protein
MMEEKEKTIHDLKLHEYLRIEDNGNDFEVCVLRVPITAFFVPWSSQFSNKGGY